MRICDLDLDELAEAQASGTVTQRRDRREDLFNVTTTALRVPPVPPIRSAPWASTAMSPPEPPESE